MESGIDLSNSPPLFYVGQHETKRTSPISSDLLQKAQERGVRPSAPASTVCFTDSMMNDIVRLAYNDNNHFPLSLSGPDISIISIGFSIFK